MILQVIVDRLELQKEGITKTFGETFEVSEDRAKEILNYKFNGKAVAVPFFYSNEDLESKVKNLESEKETLLEEIEILKSEKEDLLKEIETAENEKAELEDGSESEEENKLENEENEKKNKKGGKKDE